MTHTTNTTTTTARGPVARLRAAVRARATARKVAAMTAAFWATARPYNPAAPVPAFTLADLAIATAPAPALWPRMRRAAVVTLATLAAVAAMALWTHDIMTTGPVARRAAAAHDATVRSLLGLRPHVSQRDATCGPWHGATTDYSLAQGTCGK
jgi:hypothetical protein